MRIHLIENKIFVAQYWLSIKDWLKNEDSYESYLVDNLIPLPIDQRYSKVDMDWIINKVID
jgi:hypothetical protein